MKKTIAKYFLFTALASLVFLAIGIVYVLSHDVNEYKKEITSFFNSSTGLDISIDGKIDFDVSDGLNVTLRNVNLDDSLGRLASFDSLILRMNYSLKDSLEVHYVKLFSPVYYYRTRGIVPIRNVTSASSAINVSFIQIDTLLVENGRFLLSNVTKDTLVDVQNISSRSGSMTLDLNKSILHSFYIENDIYLSSFNAFQIPGKNIQCAFKMKEGLLLFDLKSKNYPSDDLFFSLDLNPENLFYSFKGNLSNRKVKSLYEKMNQEHEFLTGTYYSDFKFSFTSADSLNVNSIIGNVNLTSSDLLLRGVDLDKLIKRFKRTQNFSLKDLGSVMLLGPWGLALSKGSDYAGMAFISDKDSTLMQAVNFNLTLDSGVIDFTDAAFSTQKNRISLSGKIDAVALEYDQFAYSLLDKKGCAEIREVFNGPFEKEKEKSTKPVRMLLGPVTNLFKGTSEVIRDKECNYSYTGIVEHPESKGLFSKNALDKSDDKEKKKEKKKRKKKS